MNNIRELSYYSEADSSCSSQQWNQLIPTLNRKYKSTMEYPNSSAPTLISSHRPTPRVTIQRHLQFVPYITQVPPLASLCDNPKVLYGIKLWISSLCSFLQPPVIYFLSRTNINPSPLSSYLLTYLITYLLTYLLHGAESFLRSQPFLS
jgi:hypothetical protein